MTEQLADVAARLAAAVHAERGDAPAGLGTKTSEDWVSAREAARRLQKRFDSLLGHGERLPLETARSRIRAALHRGYLASVAQAGHSAIAVESLEKWITEEVEWYLDRLDADKETDW